MIPRTRLVGAGTGIGCIRQARALFRRADWLEALRRAPAIKQDFYTVLSSRDCLPEAEAHLRTDPHLRKCVAE